MPYEAITYEIRDEFAIVTPNRPKRRNAVKIAMRTGAGGAFEKEGGGDD